MTAQALLRFCGPQAFAIRPPSGTRGEFRVKGARNHTRLECRRLHPACTVKMEEGEGIAPPRVLPRRQFSRLEHYYSANLP